MKINKKALFFDIDGTLFSEKLRQVPQSAVLALKKTMEKGNLTFINTGRTWCQTSKTMLQNDNIDQKMVDDTALMQKTLDFLVKNAKITVSTEENNAALNTEAAEDEAE